MPLSEQRQRELARRYDSHPFTGRRPRAIRNAWNDASWWLVHCSILPVPARFHFWRVDGVWRFTPYVDTTATEQAIDASVKRYHSLYGHDEWIGC